MLPNQVNRWIIIFIAILCFLFCSCYKSRNSGEHMKKIVQIVKLVYKPRKSTEASILEIEKNSPCMQSVRKSRVLYKMQIKGWGIPLLGCLSISAFFWCLTYWSGSFLLKIGESYHFFNSYSLPVNPAESNSSASR